MKRIAVLLCLLIIMCGCQSTKGNDMDMDIEKLEKDTVLIDYFERTVGTPMEMPYYEVVLYTDEDSERLRLEVYTEGGTVNEYKRVYQAPLDTYEELIKIIEEEKMPEWNDRKDTIAITGQMYVCRFHYNGSQIRVSSDQMPEDGDSSFGKVLNAISSYIDDSKLIWEGYTHSEEEREAGTVIRDLEELYQYEEYTDISMENGEDYLSISSGMGPAKDEYGNMTGSTVSYISVYFKEGYYPDKDFFITASFTMDSDAVDASNNADMTWYYDKLDYVLYGYIMEHEGSLGINDAVMSDLFGSVFRFALPEEYLHEDEEGTFFYYQDASVRFYLDGHYQIEKDGAVITVGSDGNWIIDYLNNR